MVMSLRSKGAAGKAVRAGLAVEGAYLNTSFSSLDYPSATLLQQAYKEARENAHKNHQ